MPKRKARKKGVKRKRKVVRKKNIQGEGPIGDFFRKTFSKRNLKKANNFLRKHKVISRGADIASDFGVPYAHRVSKVSKKLGYGKGKEPKAIKV